MKGDDVSCSGQPDHPIDRFPLGHRTGLNKSTAMEVAHDPEHRAVGQAYAVLTEGGIGFAGRANTG